MSFKKHEAGKLFKLSFCLASPNKQEQSRHEAVVMPVNYNSFMCLQSSEQNILVSSFRYELLSEFIYEYNAWSPVACVLDYEEIE